MMNKRGISLVMVILLVVIVILFFLVTSDKIKFDLSNNEILTVRIK